MKNNVDAAAAIKTGDLKIVESYQSLYCSACNAYLGRRGTIDGHGYDDTAGWAFCPYCGRKMEDTHA